MARKDKKKKKNKEPETKELLSQRALYEHITYLFPSTRPHCIHNSNPFDLFFLDVEKTKNRLSFLVLAGFEHVSTKDGSEKVNMIHKAAAVSLRSYSMEDYSINTLVNCIMLTRPEEDRSKEAHRNIVVDLKSDLKEYKDSE